MVADAGRRETGAAAAGTSSTARGPGRRTSPWLEPDVNDHLEALRRRRASPAVVVVPIGFVSDHMEVVYDLDTEAAATAPTSSGCAFARAATAGRPPGVRRRWCATWCSSGRRAERGRAPVRAAAVGELGRRPGTCAPPAAAPTRAAAGPRCASCGRARRDGRDADSRDELLALAVDAARARPARWSRRRAGAASRSPTPSPARPTSSPRSTSRPSELIRERILAARPDDGFLGEEGGDVAAASGRHAGWSTRSTAPSTTSTASRSTPSRSPPRRDGDGRGRRRAQPVVRRDLHRHCSAAARTSTAAAPGRGAADRRPQALVGTGFGYRAEVRGAPGRARSPGCCRLVRDIRRLGSAALDLCCVGRGRLDAYVERGLQAVGPRGRRGWSPEAGAGSRAGRRAAPERLVVAAAGCRLFRRDFARRVADELPAFLTDWRRVAERRA